MKFTRILYAIVAAFATAVPAFANAGEDALFGSAEASGGALVGILYDLKQDQARKPLKIDNKIYGEIVDEFVASKWDEQVLNRYFRAGRPLYTNKVFVPIIPASAGPKAFGVEKVVKPSYWLIHYKGQVSAPSAGEWRFWGYGEEVCVVAINGRNVLVSNWREITTPSVGWKSPEPIGLPAASGHLRAGEWMTFKEGEVVDIDILIGERGGGVFGAFLLVQKKDDPYQRIDGRPVLPIFQLAPFVTPRPKTLRDGPVVAPEGPVWIARQ